MSTHPFDLAGPLPTARTRVLLEASAGTGKTYAIITLAVRFLAEGRITLPELLLITFTRDATRELRVRLRDKLTEVAAALTAEPSDTPPDPIVAAIDQQSDRNLAVERLRAALSEFDRATIATTHEFCATMLHELGMLVDHDVSEVLAEDRDVFIHEIAVDCWLRRFSKQPGRPSLPLKVREFDKRSALKIAKRVTDNPGARLWPEPDHPELTEVAREQVAFAHDVAAEFERRKRHHRVQTFDDLQDRLHAALTNPVTGDLVAQRLADRFPLVMVDEFQDTDPVQWQVLRVAFDTRSTMVLIGDPKQAIYGFRGADVHSYLHAREHADHTYTLATNHRTDRPVVQALDTLFHGATLGDGIPVTPVEAKHAGRLFTTSDEPAPGMRLLVTQGSFADVKSARAEVARHVGSHLAEVLADPPWITVGDERRRVRPADLAVLVRSSRMGELIRDELQRRRIPVVFPGAHGVFTTDAAEYWETLLRAIDQPRAVNVRALAVTPLVAWTIHDLALATQAQETELGRQIRQWGHTLAEHGVGALFDAVSEDRSLPQRLLRADGGERLLTDLRHLTQVLHRAQRRHTLNSTGLLTWLRNRRQAESKDEEPRRLETDSDVVYISTSHSSKGLEFPLVYLPDTWDRIPFFDVLPTYHDRPEGPDGPAVRMLDVSAPFGAAAQEHVAMGEAEQFDEDLRLFYVATTRAKHQVTLWWAHVKDRTPHSPLQRILFGSLAAGVTPPTDVPEPSLLRPDGLAHLTAAGIDVAYSTTSDAELVPTSGQEHPHLEARTFERSLDTRWRRTSYSGLTVAAHALAPHVSSEPPASAVDDEPAEALEVSLPDTAQGGQRSPMAELPGGTRFGTLVHAIYEVIDFQAPDLTAEVLTHSTRLLARMPVAGVSAHELTTALLATLHTPLGPLVGNRSLSSIAATDRLPELDFDYPLAGGETPSGLATLGDIADVLTQWLPPDDPLVDYPAALRDPLLSGESLRGFLTGSIDAVLRVVDSGVPRFLVVDYKTNWLGPADVELSVDAYHPAAMTQAMIGSHYPLQALLYQVALHRYLRWRLPGYLPEQHLGGTLYLFVRGMAGPDTPTVSGVPHGVFSWAPPTGLVVALSDLIATGDAS